MDLLMIRHAIAERRAEFGQGPGAAGDELRPLSARGRERMRRAARGLERLVPEVDALATSPLVRARETAEILAERIEGFPAPTLLDGLAPDGRWDDLLAWLREREPGARIAWVGHEPSLSTSASRLLSGLDRSFLTFKKGGVAHLAFDGPPAPGAADLLWLVTPGQLQRLGRGKA
jgi:phosphohistidine phosphatase